MIDTKRHAQGGRATWLGRFACEYAKGEGQKQHEIPFSHMRGGCLFRNAFDGPRTAAGTSFKRSDSQARARRVQGEDGR